MHIISISGAYPETSGLDTYLMKITIDPKSGFCFGVNHTILQAGLHLEKDGPLYCLGDIVHNKEEMNRLNQNGLIVIDHDEFNKLGNERVLLRAHGEPPSTYMQAKKNKIELLDTTCPVVIRLQQKVKKAYLEMKVIGGKVVIFGKESHPEVIGLVGNTDNTAIVIETTEDINQLNFSKPIRLFAQTTRSQDSYRELINLISARYTKDQDKFQYQNSICRQVSNRVPHLKEFCKEYDVIIFVSGKKSSNGQSLFNVCHAVNTNSYKVASVSELKRDWFENAEQVGISGATSTPSWLMEQIAEKIKNF